MELQLSLRALWASNMLGVLLWVCTGLIGEHLLCCLSPVI